MKQIYKREPTYEIKTATKRELNLGLSKLRVTLRTLKVKGQKDKDKVKVK